MNRFEISIMTLLLFLSSVAIGFPQKVICEATFTYEAKKPWYSISGEQILKYIAPRTIKSGEIVPGDFFDPIGDEVIVGINGMMNDPYFSDRETTRYLTGYYHKDNERVFSYQPRGLKDMINELHRIYLRAGPIKKLLIFGHGSSGKFDVGFETMTGRWAKNNQDLFDSLPHDLFAPDANVVLLACNCASGYSFAPQIGISSIKGIFSPLLKQGGQVVAARTLIRFAPKSHGVQKLSELDDKDFERSFAKMNKAKILALLVLVTPIMAASFFIEKGMDFVLKDFASQFGDSIVFIDIPPSTNIDEERNE